MGSKMMGSNTVIMRCPVCEPLSYWGGKTGLKEKETDGMCDLCWDELEDMLSYMAEVTGDSGYIENRSPIIDSAHAPIISAYLKGADLLYHAIKDKINWKIEKFMGIPLGGEK